MKVTDEVYREYSQMVYKYLFSLTGDAHVVAEVTQDLSSGPLCRSF